MSQVLEQPKVLNAPEFPALKSTLKSYLPAIIAVGGAFLMLALRVKLGAAHFIPDTGMMLLALAFYLIAAVFHLTNLYAPSNFAERLGVWGATLGVFFNLSSWLTRWATMHDLELAKFVEQGRPLSDMPWVFRYIPFANLYDLSLAFAFGAGITTLLVMHRKNFRIVATLSLPLAALVLTLARFIGGDIGGLMPVLDSYWRPIHVGIASLSYGIALVCFAVAVLYLLKDGVKTEAMAIWTSIFAVLVFATISKFSVFAPSSFGTYTASTYIGSPRSPLGLRADVPYAGWFMVLAGLLLVGVIIAFSKYVFQQDEKARNIGHWLLRAALVAQLIGVIVFVAQIKAMQTNVAAHINPNQYERFAVWMAQQDKVPAAQIAQATPAQLQGATSAWLRDNGSLLKVGTNANPVEFAALLSALAGTLFILIFSFRTEKLRAAMPSAEKLDNLMYKLAGVTFAGLALLLMTGAIWANESWGRYWGWDPKETGAFVAWLTYAGFLHSRISRGWSGRRSAYFAVVAFLFILFTYLGVSYLLPGLHSYA